jgi:cation diffusion facilitator CzcD-associated flavoprotein CzcO
MSAPEVIVIGAGPAGLAAAAELGRLRIPCTVLEQADSVAASWRGRYDRLRLNTCRWTSQLSHSSHPAHTGLFPSRDKLVGYLEDYAQRHALDVRVRTRAERIDRHDQGWELQTSAQFGPQMVSVDRGRDTRGRLHRTRTPAMHCGGRVPGGDPSRVPVGAGRSPRPGRRARSAGCRTPCLRLG